MVILKQCGPELLICTEDSFIVYDTATCTEIVSRIACPDEPSTKHQIQENENRAISTACYSQCGEYFAVSAGKRVLIYKRNSSSVLKTFFLQRAASKIRFTMNNNILVADKTGDAYLCTLSDDSKEATLLLGHLSMLLDILPTDCGKFVVTCDRDEKIRVSCYPNAYNIMSYCLGHKEFVTNVEIIDKYLVSASGDGTIRFWNYISGEQIYVINTNDCIKDKDLIDSFCKEMDEEKCEVSSLPIVDMQLFKSEKCTYIAVSLHNCKSIQIYSTQVVDTGIACALHCNIALKCMPVCFSFSNNLYVLTNESLLLYCLNDNEFVQKHTDQLVNFYNKYKDLLTRSNNVNISVLYKRKFDNVQEYLDRKKQRLEGKINCLN